MTPKEESKPILNLHELAYILSICLFTALAILINS